MRNNKQKKIRSYFHLSLWIWCLSVSFIAEGQHLYQMPKPLQKKAEVEKIIGKITTESPAKDLRILWVYGYDEHHIAGAHDYVKIKEVMQHLLIKVPKVTVKSVFHFPTKKEFETADLVVMYLHLPPLEKEQYQHLKNFVTNGGGLVSLHETAIMRPRKEGKKLAKCLGFAWKEGKSKWGAIHDDININNQHEIFKGFPKKLTINDEFYWDLFQRKAVKILGTVRTGENGNSETPMDKSLLSKKESPIFWTYEYGKGRIFGTTTGHHTFTYFDPEFRIILFRAMAWTVREKPDPFMHLVFEGITDELDMVGTTEVMRYWEGKRRN